MRNRFFVFIAALSGILVAPLAFAHEAYVLPHDYFWSTLSTPGNWQIISVLNNAHDRAVTLMISFGVIVVYGAAVLFWRSKKGRALSRWLEKAAFLGPVLIRVTIAIAFFMSAWTWSFLGPELPLRALPAAVAIRWALFAISGMILVGAFAEIMAVIALVIFTAAWLTYGAYLLTYVNYLGEILVLLLFGTRRWSVDGWLFGPRQRLKSWLKYETPFIRICYAFALAFAAINVKLLHYQLTLRVVTDYGLTRFHWLFPSDPYLVAFGAALAELAIAIFIALGFQLRLTVLISLFYITLSLIFFGESVWPHMLLYSISFSLIVQPETFTIDRLRVKE